MRRLSYDSLVHWFSPNVGIKRWLFLTSLGIGVFSIGVALISIHVFGVNHVLPRIVDNWTSMWIITLLGAGSTAFGMRRLVHNLLAPYRRQQHGTVLENVMDYNRRQKGVKLVAIGGGTGLPASLRGMKQYTNNITAVVTVGDDGGSSGRLRRDLGVLPPGDIRNNIAALADEDSLLTQLFQYRFTDGDLKGHSFGNLFIAALANIVAEQHGNGHNSLAEALIEVERVLNIRGRVLPSTLDDIVLTGTVQLKDSSRKIKVRGESQIGEVDGILDTIAIEPVGALAYPPSVEAILEADIVVIGPGSLFTSILPNLMVKGIADALRATDALIIYVCNVATQPVETEDYTVAEHVMALETHIGRGVFQAVIANNVYPEKNAGKNTTYVAPVPENHEILQRYDVYSTDLTDFERPWRHDTHKLANAILTLAKQDSNLASLIKSTSKELVL
ncbi:MAG: gluconeogenesis factor YvcK family protein [Chloroflexota bacterium]